MPPRRSARLAAAAAEPEPGSESDSVYYTDGGSDDGGEDEEEGEEGESDDDDDDDDADDDDDDDASDDDSSSSSSDSEASREEQTDWMRKVAADALMLYNPLESSSDDAARTPQVWRAIATKHARGVEPRSRPGAPAMRVRGVRTPQEVTYHYSRSAPASALAADHDLVAETRRRSGAAAASPIAAARKRRVVQRDDDYYNHDDADDADAAVAAADADAADADDAPSPSKPSVSDLLRRRESGLAARHASGRSRERVALASRFLPVHHDRLVDQARLRLLPIRPRSRCELHSLRTFSPGVRHSPPTPRCFQSPPSTAFNSN
jgi:hypothetical protein